MGWPEYRGRGRRQADRLPRAGISSHPGRPRSGLEHAKLVDLHSVSPGQKLPHDLKDRVHGPLTVPFGQPRFGSDLVDKLTLSQ